MSTVTSRKEKTQKLPHIFAGLIILLHAYEKYDLGEENGILFLIAGIVFLLVALLHHKLVYIFPYVDGVFYLIEGILCGFIAADYFEQGKKGLPWCYAFASVLYVLVAIIKGKKGKTKHQNNFRTTGK